MSEIKKCSGHCGETKSLVEFSFRKDTNTYRGECRKCENARHKKMYEKNKTKTSNARNKRVRETLGKRKLEMLTGIGCETCRIDLPELLEFAHKDRRTKIGNLARLIRNNKDIRNAERDKCRILCGTCHMIETHAENNSYKHIFITTQSKPMEGDKNWRQKLCVLDYLLQKDCEKCGETDVRVLEFDHIIPANKYTNIATMVSDGRSVQHIKKEIAKTRILCRNCHKLRTWKEKQQKIKDKNDKVDISKQETNAVQKEISTAVIENFDVDDIFDLNTPTTTEAFEHVHSM
jgi:hypothetical protein